jgi:putative membrane protein
MSISLIDLVVRLLVAFVCVEHVGFFILEAFLWTRPVGRKIFATTPEFSVASKSLAANQGLYNLFLAAGLAWSLFASTELVRPLQFFFLGCVIVAGVFGAVTVSKRILFVQALPASIAFGLLMI